MPVRASGLLLLLCISLSFFFFNDTATTEIYTLSLHDALPISVDAAGRGAAPAGAPRLAPLYRRSEEHTSELQSHSDLVCRLLLEKKKNRAFFGQDLKKDYVRAARESLAREGEGWRVVLAFSRKISFDSFFFFNDTATTEIYTLSLHDALPISPGARRPLHQGEAARREGGDVLEIGRARLNSSHTVISYAVFCLKKKKNKTNNANETKKNNNLKKTKKCLKEET